MIPANVTRLSCVADGSSPFGFTISDNYLDPKVTRRLTSIVRHVGEHVENGWKVKCNFERGYSARWRRRGMAWARWKRPRYNGGSTSSRTFRNCRRSRARSLVNPRGVRPRELLAQLRLVSSWGKNENVISAYAVSWKNPWSPAARVHSLPNLTALLAVSRSDVINSSLQKFNKVCCWKYLEVSNYKFIMKEDDALLLISRMLKIDDSTI